MKFTLKLTLAIMILVHCIFPKPAAWGHEGELASVHDVVASVTKRLRDLIKNHPERANTSIQDILSQLSQPERATLAQGHIQFEINTKSRLWVLTDLSLPEPFWLAEQGFVRTQHRFNESLWSFAIWEKIVAPGRVQLGVNSLAGKGIHYLVALAPLDAKTALNIENIRPTTLAVAPPSQSLQPYIDEPYVIKKLPDFLLDKTFIRTQFSRRNDAKLIGLFRNTGHLSSPQPDQVVLTWSDDPKTSQTIQWRTACQQRCDGLPGWVAYRENFSKDKAIKMSAFKFVTVKSTRLETPNTVNDPRNARFVATLGSLKPNTEYSYRVGVGVPNDAFPLKDERWPSFKTAPRGPLPFSFVYLGDAQNGLDQWGKLMQQANAHLPNVAFYLMAGDLVDRGNERDDWDEFFYQGRTVFNAKPLVPLIGNHEAQDGHPTLYLRLFDLFKNGPKTIEAERAYFFEYSNALFVILDTNLPLQTQTEWLADTLAKSQATWKFVAYHHPAYPSSKRAAKKDFETLWLPVIDKYQVDFALQGHDHNYLRTYPMYNGKPVRKTGSSADQTSQKPTSNRGTIYLITVSGTKKYPQQSHVYMEKGIVDVSTYQVFDLRVEGSRLEYRAFDEKGTLVDSVTIEK